MKVISIFPLVFIFFFTNPMNHSSGKSPEVTIEMTNTSKFVPSEITVSKGDIVQWKNTSDLVHTVTCDPKKVIKPENVALPDGANPFNSGRMKPGTVYKKRFTTSGTYIYFCIPHEVTGMVGIIIVE